MNKICLSELPDRVLNLVMEGEKLPIVIFWNSHIVFLETYRVLKCRLRQNIGSFEERAGAAMFMINNVPAVRFLPDPEFSRGFAPKTVIDISIYYGTLEKHPVEHIRKHEIRELQQRFQASGLQTLL